MGKDGGLVEGISSGSKQQRMVEVDEGVEFLRRWRGETGEVLGKGKDAMGSRSRSTKKRNMKRGTMGERD